jgi:hypothetical protein
VPNIVAESVQPTVVWNGPTVIEPIVMGVAVPAAVATFVAGPAFVGTTLGFTVGAFVAALVAAPAVAAEVAAFVGSGMRSGHGGNLPSSAGVPATVPVA